MCFLEGDTKICKKIEMLKILRLPSIQHQGVDPCVFNFVQNNMLCRLTMTFGVGERGHWELICLSRVFSLNFGWGGTNIFCPLQSLSGTKSDRGGRGLGKNFLLKPKYPPLTNVAKFKQFLDVLLCMKYSF